MTVRANQTRCTRVPAVTAALGMLILPLMFTAVGPASAAQRTDTEASVSDWPGPVFAP